MKKIFAILLSALLALLALSACGVNTPSNEASSTAAETGAEKIKIITTIFPEYEWVMNVLGDKAADADVKMLLDNGVDLHSYQPTATDMMDISSCDLFVYVGGLSDNWVDDALKEAVNADMVVVDLMEELGDSVKEEEVVEGMQAEEEEAGEEEEVEYDEHIWLSLRLAEKCVKLISDALGRADPAGAQTYESNAGAYIAKLDELDKKYVEAVDAASVKTLLFGDRFPFRYMTDDYGLDYYAAFVGCSAETEASFETVGFLAKKVDELSLRSVMTIEGTDHRIAETVIRSTASKDQRILVLDSMQACTSKDVADGVTYLSVMEKNLEVLREALK